MCLSGSALSVEQFAKKVNLKDIARGKQPPVTMLAWRTWNVQGGTLQPRLRSASQSTVWTPGKPVDAHATIKKDAGAVGVHAYKSIDELLRENQISNTDRADFKQTAVIVGQVLLWGMIAEHTNGYRAEHGYPFKIYVNGPALQVRLSEIYGCLLGRDFLPRLLKAA